DGEGRASPHFGPSASGRRNTESPLSEEPRESTVSRLDPKELAMTSLTKAAAGFAAAATAAAGITVAGAGAANAAVPYVHVAGNTVSVHVTEPLAGQTCMGMLVPPYAAADIAGAAIGGGGNLMPIIAALGNNPD